MIIQERIFGQPPSKPNCYKVGIIAGHGTLVKQSALSKYEQDFFVQCRNRDLMLTQFFIINIDVYFRTMASDLDNSFKIILDCLQKCRVIKNDNKCMKIIAQKHVDKENPRVELTLETIDL